MTLLTKKKLNKVIQKWYNDKMAINYPSSPQVNDTYSYGGRTWKYNGVAWDAITTTFGPTGPTGQIGPTGATGPIGLSDPLIQSYLYR